MVVAVHPDDETIGCGGTLLKHREMGDEIHWVIVTEMTSDAYSQERRLKRNREIEAVASAYGFSTVTQLGFPTTKLNELNDSILIDAFSSVVRKNEPTILYLPFYGDVHSDHRCAFNAGMACTKSFRYPFVKKVLLMETLSETEFSAPVPGMSFIPNVYRDISEFIKKKIQILSLYKGEIADAPFPRSSETVQALAVFRGSVAGCKFAESFMLLKDIE